MIDFYVDGDPLAEGKVQTEKEYLYSYKFISIVMLVFYFLGIVIGIIGCVFSVRNMEFFGLLLCLVMIGLIGYSLFHHVRSIEVSEKFLKITYWLRSELKVVQCIEIQNLKIYNNRGQWAYLYIRNRKIWFSISSIEKALKLLKTIIERSSLIYEMSDINKIVYQKEGMISS